MGRFVADPPVLIREGIGMNTISQSFFDDIERVYTALEDMINKDYLSPEAVHIANKIQNQRPTLEEMAKTIGQYGGFSISAGNRVLDNQENIISEIN
jgi:hypothetical protein